MDRARLRASLYLRVVLPLVTPLAAARPELGRGSGSIAFVAEDLGAVLRLGPVRVEPGSDADVVVRFADCGALGRFFAGKPSLPRVSPWGGLTHPAVLFHALRLLAGLRVLEPPRKAVAASEKELRVNLLLPLAAFALAQFNRDGHPEMNELAAGPERVFQWSVGGRGAAWLRVGQGRAHAGLGAWERRRPFVHFCFADTEAAFTVLTATGSQMSGFRAGTVQTYGSPEYTRKVALLMQKVDELLVVG